MRGATRRVEGRRDTLDMMRSLPAVEMTMRGGVIRMVGRSARDKITEKGGMMEGRRNDSERAE
jgi:hypothetical protein